MEPDLCNIANLISPLPLAGESQIANLISPLPLAGEGQGEGGYNLRAL